MQAITKNFVFCVLKAAGGHVNERRCCTWRPALTQTHSTCLHVSSCPAVVAGWLREQCSRMDANDLIVPVSDLRAWNACSALSLSPMSNIFHSLPNAVFLVQSSSPISFAVPAFSPIARSCPLTYDLNIFVA